MPRKPVEVLAEIRRLSVGDIRIGHAAGRVSRIVGPVGDQ